MRQAVNKYALSVRQACKIFSLSRTAFYYKGNQVEDGRLKKRLLALASRYPYYGYWKIYYLLRDEDFIVNHKRVYRLYKNLGLEIKKNKRRVIRAILKNDISINQEN